MRKKSDFFLLFVAMNITTVMTVQQILDRAEGDLKGEEDQFTALCYAVVSRFDLDGCSKIISRKWYVYQAVLFSRVVQNILLAPHHSFNCTVVGTGGCRGAGPQQNQPTPILLPEFWNQYIRTNNIILTCKKDPLMLFTRLLLP